MKRSLLASLTSLLLIVGGCNNSKTIDNKSESDKMFIELKELLILYSDSLKNASDSASIAHSIERYETELNKCIFRHPAGTDLELSAGQQDTLTMLTENFLALKRSKIQGLTMPADTVASDSVTQNKHDVN